MYIQEFFLVIPLSISCCPEILNFSDRPQAFRETMDQRTIWQAPVRLFRVWPKPSPPPYTFEGDYSGLFGTSGVHEAMEFLAMIALTLRVLAADAAKGEAIDHYATPVPGKSAQAHRRRGIPISETFTCAWCERGPGAGASVRIPANQPAG
jgi:hypothetical protein